MSQHPADEAGHDVYAPAYAPEYVLVEHLDGKGRILFRERFELSRRVLTVGRSVNADITLDDEHVAPLHASVEIAPDGRIRASDLGSVNGLIVDGKRQHSVSGLWLTGNALQVGRSRLRFRTSRQDLAPEKPDQQRAGAASSNPVRLAALGVLAVAAQHGYDAWLGAPRDLLGSAVTGIGLTLGIAGAWVAIWALLSRIMQEEWRFLRHTAIILGVLATLTVIDSALDLGWFAFSLPSWSARSRWLGAIALGFAIWLHLIHASSLTSRSAAVIACLVPAMLAGSSQWLLGRYSSRNVNHIDAPLRAYPPGLRLRPAETLSTYLASMPALRQAADAKLKAIPSEDVEHDE
jgi:hypothetical protein